MADKYIEVGGVKLRPGVQAIAYVDVWGHPSGSARSRQMARAIGLRNEQIDQIERRKAYLTVDSITPYDNDLVIWLREDCPAGDVSVYRLYPWSVKEAKEFLSPGWAEAVWWGTPV
jgi:hypothetical protein